MNDGGTRKVVDLAPVCSAGPIACSGGSKAPFRWLPFLLLLAALSVVFLTPRGHFYRSSTGYDQGYHHDNAASTYLAMGANTSAEHNFMGFVSKTLRTDGTVSFHMYNRFPVGGRLLLMLAFHPFEYDLSLQILSARMMMLFFFVGAAVMAYLSLCRLTAHRWSALAATCLALSSYYCLYYNDAVIMEVMPDLFAVLLTFHGMIVFVQEGRFRQVLAKTCTALLIGWHVFALLLPFVMLGVASDLASVRPRRLVSALFHSRHTWLGAAALVFGLALLSFNFASEYYGLDGRRGLSELPSFNSMMGRFGLLEWLNVRYADRLAWPYFLQQQFQQISMMFLPFGLFTTGGSVVLGIAVTCASLVGLVFVRHKILWTSLVFLGFCWSLPMRHNTTFHDFESVFYIGLPLFLFSWALLFARRCGVWGELLAVVASIAAVAIFVLSGFKMAEVSDDARTVAFNQDILVDFEAIRSIAKGKVVAVPHCQYDGGTPKFSGPFLSTSFYLAGSTILFSNSSDCASFDMQRIALADLVISRERREGPGLLTPTNRWVWLYDRAAYFRQQGR